MRETLRYLASTGKTVFVSSHILGEVQQLADVIGIIANGRLVREGQIEALLQSEGVVRVRLAPAEVDAAIARLGQLVAADAVSRVDGEDDWLAVKIEPTRAAEVNRALAEGGIFASGLESGSDLESLFLQLTSGEGTTASHEGTFFGIAGGQGRRADTGVAGNASGVPQATRPARAVPALRLGAVRPTTDRPAGARREAVQGRPAQARPSTGDVHHVRAARRAAGAHPARRRCDGSPATRRVGSPGAPARDVPRRVHPDRVVHPRARRAVRDDLRGRDRGVRMDLGHAQGRGRARRGPGPLPAVQLRRDRRADRAGGSPRDRRRGGGGDHRGEDRRRVDRRPGGHRHARHAARAASVVAGSA